jgi:hypothetical protein
MADKLARAWQQPPSTAFDYEPDLDKLRDRLRRMTDAELVTFGKQMHELVYPLRYGFDGKPMVCVFSIHLGEARDEWRRRRSSPCPEITSEEPAGNSQ